MKPTVRLSMHQRESAVSARLCARALNRRHCERSEAIQMHDRKSLVCFVAALLAMTPVQGPRAVPGRSEWRTMTPRTAPTEFPADSGGGS